MTTTRMVPYSDTAGVKLDPSFVDVANNTIGIHGDGNCLFRAIAYANGNADLGHAELRQRVCDRVAANEVMQGLHGDKLPDYIRKMRQSRNDRESWGGEPEIIAASEELHRYIVVWMNGRVVKKYGNRSHPHIHLQYTGTHYNLHIVAPGNFEEDTPRQPSQTDQVTRSPTYAEVVRRKSPDPPAVGPSCSTIAAVESETKANAEGDPQRGNETAQSQQTSTTEADQNGMKGRVSRPTKHAQDLPSMRSSRSASAAVPESGTSAAVDVSHTEEKSAETPGASTPSVPKDRTASNSVGTEAARVIGKKAGGRPRKKSAHFNFSKRGNTARTTAPDPVNPDPSKSADLAVPASEGAAAPAEAGSEVRPLNNAAERAIERDGGKRSPSPAPSSDAKRGKKSGRPKKKRPSFGGPGKPEKSVETPAPETDASIHRDGIEPVTESAAEPDCTEIHAPGPEPAIQAEHIAEDDGQRAPSAVRPAEPNLTSVHGVATLTRATLDEYIGKCPHSIVIEGVVTDLGSSGCNLDGPWSYRNKNTMCSSHIATGDGGERRRIAG